MDSTSSHNQSVASHTLHKLIEACKKIDKLMPMFLETQCPEIPWREVKGMRDHIAHGYFDIDAEVVYLVVKEEIPVLLQAFLQLRDLIIKN